MRGGLGVAVVLAGIVVSSGCSSGDQNDAGPASAALAARDLKPGVTDPLTATNPVPEKVGPVAMLSSAQEGDLSVAWTLRGMSGDRRQLVVKYRAGDGACVRSAGIRVSETSTTVTVAAFSRRYAPAFDCAAGAPTATGYLDLDAPLGHRRLIHAPVDPAWATVS